MCMLLSTLGISFFFVTFKICYSQSLTDFLPFSLIQNDSLFNCLCVGSTPANVLANAACTAVQKKKTENVNRNSSGSVTKENIPKDTAPGSQDEDIVEDSQRNSVVWTN